MAEILDVFLSFSFAQRLIEKGSHSTGAEADEALDI
jgi:hypothetical protein